MTDRKRTGKLESGSPPGFSIRVAGPRVGAARLSAADLAEIVRRTQQALKRVGEVLYGQVSGGQGRKKKDIEELCELFLVGWKPGSATAELELAPPPQKLSLFGYIGDESLKRFLTGMEELGKQAVTPAGFDFGVLQSCDALGKVLDHGIDSIRFEPKDAKAAPAACFDRPARERVRELLGKPVDQRRTEKVGRLEELNGHGGLTGRLWEPDGTKWSCFFKPEHLEVLPDAWLRTVKLVGEAVVEPSKERIFNVDAIVVLDDGSFEAPTISDSRSFWRSFSLEELAEQQGVSQVEDLDELSALWPVDDDPDEFLRHLLAERAARRAAAKEGAAE